ncbi:unnamed protein product, partial [marine sediment metagenome]
VKPPNILVRDGWGMLADWGGPGFPPNTVSMLNTPGYEPPDRVKDSAMDTYAFGQTIQDMLVFGSSGKDTYIDGVFTQAQFDAKYRKANMPAQERDVWWALYHLSTRPLRRNRPLPSQLLAYMDKKFGLKCPAPPASIAQHTIAASEYVQRASRDAFVGDLKRRSTSDEPLEPDVRALAYSLQVATSDPDVFSDEKNRDNVCFLAALIYKDLECTLQIPSAETPMALTACVQIASQLAGGFKPVEGAVLQSLRMP